MKWMLKIVIGVNHIRYVSDDIKELENIVLMYEAGEAFNYNDDRIDMEYKIEPVIMPFTVTEVSE